MKEDISKEKEVKEYSLVKIPTQHTLAIQTPEGEVITIDDGMIEILNKLNTLEKALNLLIK